MSILSRKTPFILLLGDIATFVVALWATLWIRYGAMPDEPIFLDHLSVFSYLFVIWVAVYFISGLYERRAVLFQTALPGMLVTAQIANIALSAVFFYFAPFISIAPKTNLLVYLLVSSGLIIFWRTTLYRWIVPEKRANAIIIGGGSEIGELAREVNGNPHYHLHFVSSIDLDVMSADSAKKEIVAKTRNGDVKAVVFDFYNPKAQGILPELYELLLAKVRFIDMHSVYENVFNHTALSLLTHSWFLENISAYPKYVYESLKRILDFTVALVCGIVSLVFYPFVYVAIKMEDRGPVFIIQERVGKDGKIIKIPKFRSMKSSDRGVWVTEGDERITKVGKFIRKSRIDELPQLFSVLKGDMSLVGPRPDIHDLGVKLSKEIPYYTLRNVIKPGLSGWAQIRQDVVPQSIEETKQRLAYDFYYIKHRSILLDLKIMLQTVATLAGRVGR